MSIALLVLFLVMTPIIAAYLALDRLVGAENLDNDYWLRDGIILALLLNSVVAMLFVVPKVRQHAIYFLLLAVPFVAVLSYSLYWAFTIALLGV